MTYPSLSTLLHALASLGVQRLLCKPLAENDNSKQQIYLGGGFASLGLLPFGDVVAGTGKKVPTMKASMKLFWLNHHGRLAPARGTQLILYPSYPEVRLSGFLRGCDTAPTEHLRHVRKDLRRFNNGPDGRLLFLGVRADRSVVAYLALPGSAVASEFNARRSHGAFSESGVFFQVPILAAGNSRDQLLAKLTEIHAAGWHPSSRMHADGVVRPYTARNGGGYTLESLFGIVPNGRAEPDFMGWELKAYSSSRVTLITPEPDLGFYGSNGVALFLRKYGRWTGQDTLYFTGQHRVGGRCATTGHQLQLRGFNSNTGTFDVSGGIFLVAADGQDSAGWSFRSLVEHWGRKHSSVAYVPYDKASSLSTMYRYRSPVLLGERTSFERFLTSLNAGFVVFDPAPKLESASSAHPKSKARSQFRVTLRKIATLYEAVDIVNI